MTTTPPATPAASEAPKRLLSILSLVGGLISLLCCGGPLFGIAAIVLGVMGRKREPAGAGLALAGIITGAIGTITATIFWALVIGGTLAIPGLSTYNY
jgi:hypothetical protein